MSKGGSSNLPLARVRTIMKSSPEVENVNQESLFLVTRATVSFPYSLAEWFPISDVTFCKMKLPFRDVLLWDWCSMGVPNTGMRKNLTCYNSIQKSI